jgi:pimeloyl-ACP methyl ester carboxylesterase
MIKKISFCVLLAFGHIHCIHASKLPTQHISHTNQVFSKKVSTPVQVHSEKETITKNTKIKKRSSSLYHKKRIKKVVGTFLVLLVIILALRFSPFQEVVFFPGIVLFSKAKKDEYVKEFISGYNGKPLFYKTNKDSKNEKVVLWFLGNAESILDYNQDQIEKMSNDYKADLYIFNYRGYGFGTGALKGEKQLYQDANGFFQFVQWEKSYKTENMFVMGRSLGGAFAIDIASKHEDLGGLMIDFTFTSIYQVACDKISTPLAWLLVRYRLDNISKMPKIQCPVLHLHGKRDAIINVEHGRKLKSACKNNTTYHYIEYGGGHMQYPPNEQLLKSEFIKNPTNSY